MPMLETVSLSILVGAGIVAFGILYTILAMLIPNLRGGRVQINEDEVGIIYKKFSFNPFRRELPRDKVIAAHGEPGWQVDTLAPGPHFGYYRWQYRIETVPMTVISHGQIGLVNANDGRELRAEQLLGQAVKCKYFQDGRAFLRRGGQKGGQLQILPVGQYRINTKLFDVITTENATQHNLDPSDLAIYKVEEDKIGIVTTLGGAPLPAGEIAGPHVDGHDNFQNLQAFLEAGGRRGLQEEYLASGAYRLNPWFVKVRQISLTKIPPATVGVVISNVGLGSEDDQQSGHNLVERGHKGIWRTPLLPGNHPINGEVMDVAIVPTNPIALDWSNRDKRTDNYDADLRPLQLRSRDGFTFELEVTQVISIRPEDAPRMIASIGVPKTDEANLSTRTQVIVEGQKYASIRSLVTKVLEPTIGNYFRNASQGVDALDFQYQRIMRQDEAKTSIGDALKAHGVRAVDTLINEITLPDRLARQLMDRAEAELKRDTLKAQQLAQKEQQELERRDANFAEEVALKRAEAKRHEARAEADAIEWRERAEKAGLQVEAEAVNNHEAYAQIRKAAEVAKMAVPQVVMGGGGGGSNSSGFEQLIMAQMLGIDLGQPRLESKQPQYTPEQIDVFIDALGGYIKEGGAEKIREALLQLSTGSTPPAYRPVEGETQKQLEQSDTPAAQVVEPDVSIDNGPIIDRKDGSTIKARRRVDLSDFE